MSRQCSFLKQSKSYIDDGLVLFTTTDTPPTGVECTGVICFNIPCQHRCYKPNRWVRNGISFLEFHTPNSRTPPNMAQISLALEFIEEQYDNGGKTFIKSYSKACRSATLMCCYLMANHSYSLEKAKQTLQGMQPYLEFSEQQEDCLNEFNQMLLRTTTN